MLALNERTLTVDQQIMISHAFCLTFWTYNDE